MQLKFQYLSDPQRRATFKNIGVLTCDDSSTKATTANKTNILIIEKSADYFEYFKANRGQTIMPMIEGGSLQRSQLRIMETSEVLTKLKPTDVMSIFSGRESYREEFYNDYIVGVEMIAYNPSGTERSVNQYYGAWNSFSALNQRARSFDKSPMSMNSSTAWRNGIGMWYCATNDLFYLASAYEKYHNDSSNDSWYAYTEDNAPFVQLASQQNLGSNNYAMPTHTYIGNGATTSLAPILDVGFPEYKNESSSFNSNFNNANNQVFRYFLLSAIKPEPEVPEYPTPTPQEPEGGNGNFDDTSEDVPIDPAPQMPIGSLIHVYEISPANQNALHSFLWSEDFIDIFLKSVKQDPFTCLVGLQYMPINPNTGSASIYLGNVNTEIEARGVPNRVSQVDFGKLAISEYWGNFLDYNPYTKVSIYCPYCGTVPLNTDVVMNSTIGLKYYIDVVSGGILGYITSNDNIIHTVTGNCATQIPLTVSDKSQMITNTISGLIGGAGSIASGSIAGMVSSTASVVAGAKEHPEIKGNYAGNIGSLGKQGAYLIIERPVASIPSNFAHQKGFRSNITRSVSQCSGFTAYDQIHLEGIPCTDAEREELESILKDGIIA